MTAALWASDPFGPNDSECSEAPAREYHIKVYKTHESKFNSPHMMKPQWHYHPVTIISRYVLTGVTYSVYLLALSHAPPVLDADMATLGGGQEKLSKLQEEMVILT